MIAAFATIVENIQKYMIIIVTNIYEIDINNFNIKFVI